jgi:hypothetical protein
MAILTTHKTLLKIDYPSLEYFASSFFLNLTRAAAQCMIMNDSNRSAARRSPVGACGSSKIGAGKMTIVKKESCFDWRKSFLVVALILERLLVKLKLASST